MCSNPFAVSPLTRPEAVRVGDRMVARAVFLILLAFFTATMVTQPDVMDGESEYQTTSSLVRKRSFALGGTPEAEAIIHTPQGDRVGFNGRTGGPGREDEFFSWFGVGQAYAGVPFYLAGTALRSFFPIYDERNAETTHMGIQRSEYFEHLLVGWRNPLLSALTAALIVLSSRRLGARRSTAFVAGLAYGLCTFAWPQARSTLNSVQTTFFLFLAFHQVLVIEESFARYARPARKNLLLCGFALGAAFLTRSLTAPVLVVIGLCALVVLWKGHRRHGSRMNVVELGWILLPALALLVVFLGTNLSRFGSALEQGYGDVVTFETYFNYPLHHGLLGILFSPGQGLLWVAPGGLLALAWCKRLLGRGDFRMPLVLLGIAAAVLVPVCITVGWHGAWGYGPRYALPLLPFLWLAVAPTFDAASESPIGRALAYGLVFVGLLTSVPGVLVDTTTHTDLAEQAARLEWPDDTIEGPETTKQEERFHRIRTDWRFAAPWAHWRILRHRVATQSEEFPLDEIFYVEDAARTHISPRHERETGFLHLAWIDFQKRLGGPLWPAVSFCVAVFLLGTLSALRGLAPDQP